MRIETGYGFDRAADTHRFAVAYPDALEHGGDWNDCGTVGDVSADGPATSSVMIMNGTADPLVPFDGGHVSLFGFSYKYGKVMSSQASAQYFADLNRIGGMPATNRTEMRDGNQVDEVLWRSDSKVEVELVRSTAADMASHSPTDAVRGCWVGCCLGRHSKSRTDQK
jgi:poly(3-hydroxybutyrate) depolymerase